MLMPLRQIAGATILAGAVGGAVGGYTTGDPYLAGAAALASITLPIALAAKMTDPAFVRRLVFGIRNPTTGTGRRALIELGKEMGRVGGAIGASSLTAPEPLSTE